MRVADGSESTYRGLTPPDGVAQISFTPPPPPPGIQAQAAAVEQIRGYHATVTYTLPRPIADTDTGDLTINIATGDLGTDAFGVSGQGDFACDDANNRCEYVFDSDGDGTAENVGSNSLELVLSAGYRRGG